MGKKVKGIQIIKGLSEEETKKYNTKQSHFRWYIEQISRPRKLSKSQKKKGKLPDPNELQGFETKEIIEVQPGKNTRDAENIKYNQPVDQKPTKGSML